MVELPLNRDCTIAMRILKHGIAMLLITSLAGCGMIGGLFNKNDGNTDAPNLLNEPTAKKQWFCYGSQMAKAWECENAPDESKISPIKPKAKSTNAIASDAIQSGSERSAVIRSGSQDPLNDVAPRVQSTSSMQAATKSTTTAPIQIETDGMVPLATVENQAQILTAPRDYYAVQLLALKRESDLLEYASLNGISEPFYMPIASGGSNWFVLLLGVYADKQSAETAMADWEKTKTLKIRPWVRQLGQLQDAMRAAQEG